MKRVYICGSFRFAQQMQEVGMRLRNEGLEFSMSDKSNASGIDGCLEKINKADVVYVVNPEGYVGKSVSIDIGYAFGRNKPVFLMCEMSDPSIMGLVEGVLSFEGLVDLIKRMDSSRNEKGS